MRLLAGVFTTDAPTLSGALSGAGGHSFRGADVRVALTGASANSFLGLCFTSIDLFLDKPVGITAVPGNLRAEEGATVLWARDNQVGDGATLTLHGATADLNDKTETISNLIFDFKGGVLRTGFPGGLRLNGTLRSGPTVTTPSPRIEGNLLLGAPSVGVAVGGAGPPVGLEIAAAISPAVTGARLDLLGGGGLRISGVCTAPARIAGGTLEVNSTSPAMSVTLDQSDSGGTVVLAGTGTVGSITVGTGGGIVAPGNIAPANAGPGNNSPGLLRCGSITWSGDAVSFSQQTFFSVDIKGTAPGTGSDQLNVTGTVALNGAIISINTLGFTPLAGTSFTLIANDGSDPVIGTLRGFPQGALLGPFSISYTGEPATMWS